MKAPVIAIGLDAADPELMEEWIAAGHLPNIAALRAGGAWGRVDNLDHYKAETPWTTFLTGCLPSTTGYWTPVKLKQGSYEVEEIAAYDYSEVSPFYALGENYRVAVFDIPQTSLSEDVNGPQVLAWGAHSPQTESVSSPPELLEEIVERHGPHPALHRDDGDWWDEDYLKRLHAALLTGIERRAAICREWLEQERWDLFMTIFSETHSAGHDFWHLSRPDHPLYGRLKGVVSDDPLLDVFRAIDRAIGEIVEVAPKDCYTVVFSIHGSDNNVSDVTSMALLPEFLYRFSFPGKAMLAPGKVGAPLPPPLDPVRKQHWQHDMQSYRYDPNPLRRALKKIVPRRAHHRLEKLFGGPVAPDLYTLHELKARDAATVWQPAQWYSKSWPRMKAFALPSFSEGYIRINLQGREPQGVVAPEDYAALCDELERQLHQLTNPRDGKRVVKKVIRTRTDPLDDDSSLPDADLVVVWADTPADVVDHPQAGRIGPVPFRRTGSHRARGFLAAGGPGIAPGTELPNSHAVDLPATILDLMGAGPRNHMDGAPVVSLRNLRARAAVS